MFAVIETGGKQYKVSVGDTIKIEKIEAKVGDKVNFDKVLCVNDGSLVIGTPTVSGKSVQATVVEQARSKKVIVYKYKRKSGYHKKNGHKQYYTSVKIDSIN